MIRSDAEISEVLADCDEAFDDGMSSWPGMTYEQGVAAAIRWMTNAEEAHPFQD